MHYRSFSRKRNINTLVTVTVKAGRVAGNTVRSHMTCEFPVAVKS